MKQQKKKRRGEGRSEFITYIENVMYNNKGGEMKGDDSSFLYQLR